MNRRICIVSPGNLASNPRVLKEADALHGAGYDVTAVVCDYTEELRDFDDKITAKVPWTVVRVPRPLGERAISIVADRLARIIAGTGARVPVVLAGYAHGGPVSALRRAALAVPADLYIAHYTAGLAAAAPVARHHRAMLGFDAEDFHSGEGGDGPGEAFRMKMVETIEATNLPSCAYVTAASPLIGKAYATRYGLASTTVLNVFPLDLATASTCAGAASGEATSLRVYWFSQTIGLDRGLQTFLQAMTRTRTRVTFDVRGGNQWGGGDRLMALARDLGIGDRVSLLPKAPPDQMVVLAAAYDVGLSLELESTENRRLCLGNKIFTYLLAGLPVVMSDTPAQCNLAPDLGAAAILVSLSDPDTIAAALDRLASSPGALAEAKSVAFRLSRDRYNWNVEKNALLRAVAEAFARREGGPACKQ
ncbi:MAG: glycosyltransferase [Reyranella sp.]|nr:glycosyltransferase [Reyranella sp.]